MVYKQNPSPTIVHGKQNTHLRIEQSERGLEVSELTHTSRKFPCRLAAAAATIIIILFSSVHLLRIILVGSRIRYLVKKSEIVMGGVGFEWCTLLPVFDHWSLNQSYETKNN